MSNQFQFQRFTIRQDHCAMKVGTDGVLLGAWGSAASPVRILDIGTGTGLIALMLGQRFPEAFVDAIEIDQAACQQAADNFRASPWSHRIHAVHGCVKSYLPNCTYDLIVSNPPWFVNSQRSSKPARNVARHSDSLRIEELVAAALRLLSDEGQFCTVLPVLEGRQLIELTRDAGLDLRRLCEVRPNPETPPKRLLLQFARSASVPALVSDPEELIIETSQRHEYTPGFRALAGEFYLRFQQGAGISE